MRVVWFTNVMMPEFSAALGLSAVNVGGWMPSLAEAILLHAKDIELTIACKHHSHETRSINGIRYVALGSDVAGSALRLVNELSPDIIHVHGTETIALELPDEILSAQNTIVSIQGVISGLCHHYNGGLSPCDVRPDRNLVKDLMRKTGMFQIQRKWIEQRSRRERRIISCVRHFAGRTEWDRAWIKYLNPNASYSVVGELLRAPFLCGRRAEENVVRHRIYCSAAAAYPLKGCHWLLLAIASLKRIYPDVELHIAAAAGVNPPASLLGRLRWGDYPRHLWRMIQELGIAENVKLMSGLNGAEVAQELREAEVFCLPSHCENSPNSLAEAMMMGVPSIATYVGGIPSILANGREGVLVQSGDPAVLANVIDHYFSNPVFAQQCADRAYETANNRYDAKVVVAQLLSAYREVMSDASVG